MIADHMHEDSLKGIEGFSHLEIIFYVDRVSDYELPIYL